MIVRILNDAQYDVPEASRAELEQLDDALESALHSGDEDRFATALAAIEDAVKRVGTPLDPDVIVPSDLALPVPGSTLAEVQDLLDSEDAGEQ